MKVKELIASRIEAAFDQVGLTGPAIVPVSYTHLTLPTTPYV